MKRAVLQFTACVLAAGMTVSGTGIAAFAAKDDALAGFGGTAVQSVSGSTAEDTQESETTAETQTEEAVTEAATEATTEAAQEAATEAVQETAAEAAQDTTDVSAAEETENSAQAGVLDTSMNGQMAFAQCEEYINVRKEASTDSEVVGKVYNNGSVTILGAIDGWYKVQSGNATGYVNAEYFATGAQAEAIAKEVAYNVATVYSDALTVRSQPSEDSEAIGTVYSSDQLEVVAYEGDWMKVALGNDVYGYVNAYYVGYDTYYATAETLDEEQARLDQQWTDYLAQQKAEEDRQNQQWQEYLDTQAAQASAAAASYEEQSYEAPQTEAPQTEAPQETAPETEAPSYSSTGSQVVNFATQFVGNPYVWGGTSLTNGADCSGFTQSVFANFGISIPRTAAAQASSGTPVSLSDIQAGDLLFYSNGSGIGHVTIYMGNGQVVHASNSNTGITISDYGYRTPVSARRYW